MRKINEHDFSSFTIAGNGWSVTLQNFKDALKRFSEMANGTLYGNKPDGTQAILDTKMTN